MSYVENPNLYGGLKVRFAGVPCQGGHPVEFTGSQNTFASNTNQQEVWNFTQSTGDMRLYDEFVTVAPIPARPDTSLAVFPPSSFSSELQTVKIYADIPLESRGGIPYIEVYLNTFGNPAAIASFREGNDSSIYRLISSGVEEDTEPAFFALRTAFLSGDPIQFTVSGFESFDTWTEARALSTGSLGMQAWGIN